jgi:hypothetical protein
MLAAVNALRLSAVAVTAVLAAAAALGSCGSGQEISVCSTPTRGEPGADGGLDPCHCDPPASLNITTCLCLSGDQQYVDAYNQCILLYQLETEDAGAEGGP